MKDAVAVTPEQFLVSGHSIQKLIDAGIPKLNFTPALDNHPQARIPRREQGDELPAMAAIAYVVAGFERIACPTADKIGSLVEFDESVY